MKDLTTVMTLEPEESKVVNKKDHQYMESNLVYPTDNGYIYVARLDTQWVEGR